jgi:hypothetical protein
MPKVFVSDAILQERLIIGPPRPGEDQPRWGWKALSALYQASLAACGYRIAPIVRPEIYQTDLARQVLGVEPGDWHLAVKPLGQLRPFHGIPNIFVCDWPYPELSAAPIGDSPFFDQARLLRMADAILCCTDATCDTLRAAGVERAVTLPPYSPPPPEGTGAAHAGTGGRFLSIVEADHLARQLGPTIAGFAMAAQLHEGLSLILCVQGAGAERLADLRQRVAQAGAEETITVLGWGGAAALHASADFFLCADAAAGLPLPLVEAMLAGLPLVTTVNAGVASFLPKEAVVPIATERGTVDRTDEAIARFFPLTCHRPTAEAVCDAVLAAAALGPAVRSRMAANGREIAERRFGLAAFKAGFGALGALVSLEQP